MFQILKMLRSITDSFSLSFSLFRPESLGIICGAFYLVTVFTYIPFNFLKINFNYLNLIGQFRLAYPVLTSAEFEQDEVTYSDYLVGPISFLSSMEFI